MPQGRRCGADARDQRRDCLEERKRAAHDPPARRLTALRQKPTGLPSPSTPCDPLVETAVGALAHLAETADAHDLSQLRFAEIPHVLLLHLGQRLRAECRLLGVACQVAVQHDPEAERPDGRA